ncbi:MAG TPA: calcium-binding protein [Actinomycetota bacterium]|nr:calcium-binding protein [Actinomycetota bacterium]
MTYGTITRRAGDLALVVCLAAVTSLLTAGPSSARRIECAAQDPCRGTNESERLFGTRGSDVILGLGSGDVLSGKQGNDELRGGHGFDRVRGGRGHDVVGIGPYREPAQFPGDYWEYLEGGSGHDVMYGNDGYSVFTGGDGNDTMYGRGSRDDYWYETPDWGHDVIVDLPDPDWHNMLSLTTFHDDLVIDLNSSGDQPEMRTVDGDATVDWDDDAITFVFGAYGDDVVMGNELDNIVDSKGDDTIYGGGGYDFIQAVDPEGFAIIFGDEGDDVIDVRDAIYPRDGAGDTVDCGAGDADSVRFDEGDTVTNCEILNPDSAKLRNR